MRFLTFSATSFACLLTLIVGTVVGVSVAKGPSRQAWEYCTVRDPRAGALQNLGNNGWEMISASNDGWDGSVTCFFKRAK
jgi:hypothetical protein